MAVVNIVVSAINKTKAVFQEVGIQAANLNKQLSRVSSVFKGLFITGIVARFTKELIDAGTYAKNLEDAAAKTKKAWENPLTTVSDGLAKVLIAAQPLLEIIGKAVDYIVKAIQFYYAFLGSLSVGAGPIEAGKAAVQTIEALDKENEERRKAIETQKEQEKVAEEQARKEEERAKKLETINERIRKKEKDAAESKMATSQLLSKRMFELISATMERQSAEKYGDELSVLEAIEKEIDLQKEVAELQDKYAKEREQALQDAANLEKEARDQWARGETEKFQQAKLRIEQTTRAEIQALRQQAEASRQNAEKLLDQRESLFRQVVDAQYREEVNAAKKKQKEEEKIFKDTLAAAEKLSASGLRRQLTPEQELALQASEAEKQAQEEMDRAAKLEQEAIDRENEMVRSLESIDQNIKDLLTLKG